MRISIKPTEQFNREIVETFKAIEEGRAVPHGPEISFASLDVFRQLFTEKRIHLQFHLPPQGNRNGGAVPWLSGGV